MIHMKILVVDDEKKIAETLTQRLILRGFDAMPVFDGESALSRLREDSFDGIILDLRLPDIDGIEILKETKALFPGMRIVILSGHGSDQEFKTCLELGAVACFHKPAKILKIIEALVGSDDENTAIPF